MMHLRQSGFTLLEAVVSMVLISGAGFALFGWINSNIIALNRIQETNTRSAATQNVVEKDLKKQRATLPSNKHVGRNDPCLCGSNKKYKKCCLSL